MRLARVPLLTFVQGYERAGCSAVSELFFRRPSRGRFINCFPTGRGVCARGVGDRPFDVRFCRLSRRGV